MVYRLLWSDLCDQILKICERKQGKRVELSSREKSQEKGKDGIT